MIDERDILDFCQLYNEKLHDNTGLKVMCFCEESDVVHVGYFLGHIFSDTPIAKAFYKEIVEAMTVKLKELNIDYKIALDGKLIGVIINENAFYDFLTYLKILN